MGNDRAIQGLKPPAPCPVETTCGYCGQPIHIGDIAWEAILEGIPSDEPTGVYACNACGTDE